LSIARRDIAALSKKVISGSQKVRAQFSTERFSYRRIRMAANTNLGIDETQAVDHARDADYFIRKLHELDGPA